MTHSRRRTTLLTVLIVVTLLALRIRTFGWFLVLFGLIVLAVALVHLIMSLIYNRRIARAAMAGLPVAGDRRLYWLTQALFIGAWVMQVDFGDTEESIHIVIQYIIGENRASEFLLDHWGAAIALFAVPLVLCYIALIARSLVLHRRVRGAGESDAR